MGYLFTLLLGAAGWWFVSARLQKKNEANFQAQVLARFTGVWPVFPTSPWDDTVKERADEISAGFVEHGNTFPKYVQPYYYNDVIRDESGKERSTASLSWQNCLVLYMHDYLRRVDEFHAKQYAKDPEATREYLGGQSKNLNTF